MDNNKFTSTSKYIQDKIRKNYLRIVDDWLQTGEYSRNKCIRFLLIILYSAIYFLIPLSIYMYDAFNFESNLIVVGIISIILSPFAVWIIAGWQNRKIASFIKQQCIKNIMQNLLQIEYKDPKEYERYIEQYADDALNFDDVKELKLAETFSPQAVMDFFVGCYKNIKYSLQELAIYVGTGKSRYLEYVGLVIKANANLNVNGWIDVQDKKIISKTRQFIMNYCFCLAMLLTLVIPFLSLPFIIEYIQVVAPVCFIVIAVACYFFVSKILAEADGKEALEKQLCRLTNNKNIDEKLCVKTSDKSIDISRIVTPDLLYLIEELKNLFKMKTLHFRINNNKIFLTIDKRSVLDTDMFELGGLLSSPKSRKVREKFISQLSGILLFLDYIYQLSENLRYKTD